MDCAPRSRVGVARRRESGDFVPQAIPLGSTIPLPQTWQNRYLVCPTWAKGCDLDPHWDSSVSLAPVGVAGPWLFRLCEYFLFGNGRERQLGDAEAPETGPW